MEFTPEVKDVILNYLKDGQREMAMSYISRTFQTSHYDSRQLLEAFEIQFASELKGSSSQKFDATTCSGCFSRILKFMAILIAILAIGIFGLGYLFIDLFGDNWNNRRVPVIVTGWVYSGPDSTYVNLIYEYRGNDLRVDTTTREYEISSFHQGDTIQVPARDLGLGFDDETIQVLNERQQLFYLVAGFTFLVAIVFWAVSAVFKIRPPSTDRGRYSR